MNCVALGEIAEINPRDAELAKLDLATPLAFVPMSSVKEDGTMQAVETRPYSDLAKGFTAFRNGDILLAKITPCFENNKIALARIDTSIGFGSTEFHVLRPRNGKLDSRYLLHFIRQRKVLQAGKRRMTGSAGQRRVPRSFLEELEIPLPPIEEQKRIAAILDKADELRRLRQRAIDRLNQLSQSTFAHHQKQLDAAPVKLSDLCHRITDGTHQSPIWAEEGIPFLFVSNIRNQEINFETDKYVSEVTYQSLTRKTSIDAGDVLYTCVGSYGHAAVVPDDQKFIFQRHIAHLKPDPAAIDSTYLMFLLESPEVRRQADKGATGIAQKTVTLSVLNSILVKVPDIRVQRRVARYLSRVRGQRRKLLCYIQKQNLLFSSIQHRAFRGEL